MLQNAYFLAKIGADTAENERMFAQNLPKNLPKKPQALREAGPRGRELRGPRGPARAGPRVAHQRRGKLSGCLQEKNKPNKTF